MQKILLLLTLFSFLFFFLFSSGQTPISAQTENTTGNINGESPTQTTESTDEATDKTIGDETPVSDDSSTLTNNQNLPSNARTDEFPVTNIDTLILQGNIIIKLAIGHNESLSVAYTNELVDKFTVEQKENKVTIKTKESLIGTLLPNDTNTLPALYVTMSMKTIQALSLKGKVALSFTIPNTVIENSFTLTSSGKNSIEGRTFTALKTDFKIGSNTTMSFKTLKVDDLTIKAAKRNTLAIDSLETLNAHILLSGKGNSLINKKFLHQHAILDIQGSKNNIEIIALSKNPNLPKKDTEEAENSPESATKTATKTVDSANADANTEANADANTDNSEPSYSFSLNIKSKKNNITISTIESKDMQLLISGKNELHFDTMTLDTLTAKMNGRNTLSINTAHIDDSSTINIFGTNTLSFKKIASKNSFIFTQEGKNTVTLDTLQGREATILLTGSNTNTFKTFNTTFMTLSLSKTNILSMEKMRAKDTLSIVLQGTNTLTAPYLRGKHIKFDIQEKNNTITIGRLLANNSISINNTAGNITHIEELKTRELFIKNEYLMDIQDIFITYLLLKSKTYDANLSITAGSIGSSDIILFENAVYNAPNVLSNIVFINTKQNSQTNLLVDTKITIKAENNSIINYKKYENITIINNSSPTATVIEGETLYRKKEKRKEETEQITESTTTEPPTKPTVEQATEQSTTPTPQQE